MSVVPGTAYSSSVVLGMPLLTVGIVFALVVGVAVLLFLLYHAFAGAPTDDELR